LRLPNPGPAVKGSHRGPTQTATATARMAGESSRVG
jgi:hypothetical protein